MSTASLAQANVPAQNVSTAIGADEARADYGIDGTGLRIGILSSSFDTLGGAAADEADGWLPPADQVNVLRDNPAGTTDEGRAMAEMVHAIAPGASIDFYSPSGQANGIAQGIQAMQADGCSVICDDITRADEPMWQLGALDEEAIRGFTRAGGVYFTDASNAGVGSARQDTFTPMDADLPGIGAVTAMDFGAGGASTPYNTFTVGNTAPVAIDFQWAQTWASLDGTGTPYSLGIAIYDQAGNLVMNISGDQTGQDPIQSGTFKPPATGTYSYAVYVNGGTLNEDDLIKVVMNGDGDPPLTIAGADSGSCFGHNADPDAITVGAVKLTHTPAYEGTLTNETFSSGGDCTYVYNAAGSKLAHDESSGSVDVSAPDGQATSLPSGEMNPYYGTSAATPVAAALGLLMKAANGDADANEVRALMTGTADAFGDASYSGSGLVQAQAALAMTEESNTLLRNDLYQDGHAAIVFQDGSGTDQVWGMKGDKVAATSTAASPGAGWKYVASGDFDGAGGGADLVWQDAACDLAFGSAQSGSVGAAELINGPGRGWTCVGSGDFNGDGNSDLVFQNAARQVTVDLMQGDQVVSSDEFLIRSRDGAKVVGIGDFDKDGTSDLLLESRDGSLSVLYMSDGKPYSREATGFKLTSTQTIGGIGDLDGKGSSDVLVQDASNGALESVSLGGGNPVTTTLLGYSNPTYKAVGVGHFDSSQQDGILMQDPTNGSTEVLSLSGNSIYQTNLLGTPGHGWAAGVK